GSPASEVPAGPGPNEPAAAGGEPGPAATASTRADTDEQPASEPQAIPEAPEPARVWTEPAPGVTDAASGPGRGSGVTPSLAGEQIATILAAAQEAAQRSVDQAQGRAKEPMAKLARPPRQVEAPA